MYDPLRCSFATLVPRLSDSVLPYGPAGLRMTSASIHHCDHCEILSPLILWRGCQSPSCCCCPLSNGFIAFLSLFVVPWPDGQWLVELNHLAPTGGQVDPNDDSIARCRRAFRSTRCDRAQFLAGVNAMPGRQICVVDDAV